MPRGRGTRQNGVSVMTEAEIDHRKSLHAKMAVLNKRGA
jgi:hypothetical protein